MNQLFDKKESWGKELELLTDVKLSLAQLARGRGIVHQDAKNIILKRIHKSYKICMKMVSE